MITLPALYTNFLVVLIHLGACFIFYFIHLCIILSLKHIYLFHDYVCWLFYFFRLSSYDILIRITGIFLDLYLVMNHFIVFFADSFQEVSNFSKSSKKKYKNFPLVHCWLHIEYCFVSNWSLWMCKYICLQNQ